MQRQRKSWDFHITQEQIDELKAHAEDINYDVAKEREKVVRHDVMSHVYAYGVQCPKAKGIIHLGATSCYVGDNTDIILMSEALKLVKKKLVNVIAELAKFADEHKESADTCIYTFPAGAADNGWKTCNFVDAGIYDGSGRSGVCTRKLEAAWFKGNYRYTGKFPGTV